MLLLLEIKKERLKITKIYRYRLWHPFTWCLYLSRLMRKLPGIVIGCCKHEWRYLVHHRIEEVHLLKDSWVPTEGDIYWYPQLVQQRFESHISYFTSEKIHRDRLANGFCFPTALACDEKCSDFNELLNNFNQ